MIFHRPLFILSTGCQSKWTFLVRPSPFVIQRQAWNLPHVNIDEDDIAQAMQCRECLYCYCTYYLGRYILGLLGIETWKVVLVQRCVFNVCNKSRYI